MLKTSLQQKLPSSISLAGFFIFKKTLAALMWHASYESGRTVTRHWHKVQNLRF
jgi:hypothetical protein